MSDTPKMYAAHYREPKTLDSGDTRFTLDADAGDVVMWPADPKAKSRRPVLEIEAADGSIIRRPLPRNVYVPGGTDVGEVVVRVAGETVKLAPSATPVASGGADPVFTALRDAADEDGLTLWYVANLPGAGKVTGRKLAKATIARHHGGE